ncbi:MAG TPA: glycosyltransferase family A protein [Gemmatimonadaceae bacterium]|nr:glycosyltransferase family A protein [Gemmatimonadaceae bacterium]
MRAAPIIVINGPDAHPDLVRELRADRRVRVQTNEVASLPAALLAGRKLVDAPFFSALDDDDLFLPGGLAAGVRVLSERHDCDAVITNGIRRDSAGDTLTNGDMAIVERDPLRAMFRSNWLLPGSWLCRTERVGTWLFEGMPSSLETTYTGVQLATRCRLAFLNQPTVVWHAHTANHLSGSKDWVLAHAAALQRLLELDLPHDVKASIRRQRTDACHSNSEMLLREGRRAEAWRWHVRSLLGRSGWRYFPYTLRFIMGLPRD